MDLHSHSKGIKTSIPFFRLLRTRLILFFLTVSIIPLAIVGWWSFFQSQNTLREQVSNQLVIARDLNAYQLETFFQTQVENVAIDSASPWIADALREFASADDFYAIRLGYLGDSSLVNSGQDFLYDTAHARYYKTFKKLLESREYADIYLVASDGTVVYNFDKGDDFATNLLSGPYRDTHFSKLFQELQNSANPDDVIMTDFVPYGPSRGEAASFVGSPIMINGRNVGALVYQLPLERLNDLMQRQSNAIGKTGDVYLVGQDKLMRSDSRFSEESTILEQEVDNSAVLAALAGETGIDQVIDYRGISALVAYQPMVFGSQTWALVSQISEEEAFRSTINLRNSVILFSILAALAVALAGLYLASSITKPISSLTEDATIIAKGDLSHPVTIKTRDEIGVLAKSFSVMTERLRDLVSGLEQEVAERTQALEQRSAYLEGSAEVSRTATSILDPNDLIQQVVGLIRKQFDLYYVGLFLVDERNEWAVLQAGTGEAGQNMLAANHRLKIGEGMIGWSIANAESRIALDVGDDAVRFENPFLPETRSEGALPLRSRGRVLGALTVQSNQPAAFDQDIINSLQTMVDQIAVALDNAELFAKSESALEAERKAYGELSREAWVRLSKSQTIPRYISDTSGSIRSIAEEQSPGTLKAIQNGKIVQDDNLTVIIPIKNRGQILGGVKLRKPKDSGIWTQDQLETVKTLAEQLSISLESARLFDQTQRRAERERVIGEAASRMRETLDIERVLQTAAEELHKALGGMETKVWLDAEQADSEKEKNDD